MENNVEKKNVNRESKSLELTIQLYRCYGEHEYPSSCITTVYLSNGKYTYQTNVNRSPNTAFIWDNNLKLTLNQVEFLDALFPVYKQNKGGFQNTPSLLHTE